MIAVAIYPNYLDNRTYNKIGSREYLNFSSYTHRFIARGFIYPFIHSIGDYMEEAPEGYAPDIARQLLNQYEEEDIPADKKVNIIVIMREAYTDFSDLGLEGLNSQPWDIYHRLESESYTGDLLTNAAYGYTIYTERNFLTGNYVLKNFRGNTNSYPWYFRRQGYTVEGCHPYYQWFYNRQNVNGFLGFERYRFLEGDFENLTDARYPEDSILFSEIYKDFIANKTTGKPYFSFNVTVATHGPYSTESFDGNVEYLTGDYSEECKNVVNNYLSRIVESDVALMDLVENLRSDSSPTILVTFGDHLPWMGNGNEFYDELGINIDTNTEEGFRTYYSTRYLIWANDAAKGILGNNFEESGPEISPIYLMNIIFQQIGWRGPAFMQAMNDIMEVFPVITTNGYYVVDGVFADVIPSERQAIFQNFIYLQWYWRKNFYMGR